MPEPGETERIDALEMRLAHQETAIDDLNAALTGQWAALDALTREVRRLNERLRENEARAGDGAGPEPPPPHY